MGTVYADIELINASDIDRSRRYQIGEEEIRSLRVNMLVDSGAYMMAINENIQTILGLEFRQRKKLLLANDKMIECDIVGPVEVRFANRTATCSAFVLPGDSEPLLGLIPMEEMDVLIHPQRQELIVNPKHPDYAVLRVWEGGEVNR
ncbi:MAG TPA: retropepsin-like aspartic protease [Puia sp.]|nr:retropepsin-like aspartic protease [Puia sp.]